METLQRYFPIITLHFPITSPLTGMETKRYSRSFFNTLNLSDHISPNGDGNAKISHAIIRRFSLSDHISPNGDGNFGIFGILRAMKLLSDHISPNGDGNSATDRVFEDV